MHCMLQAFMASHGLWNNAANCLQGTQSYTVYSNILFSVILSYSF